jgi:hypothetical protein
MFNTNPDQTNTRPAGPFAVLAGEDLTGMRSRLVKLTHDTGIAEVKLPTTINDLPLYLLNEEGIDASLVAVEPLAEGGPSRRVVLKGTCNPGDALVLAAIAGADAGKVRALPATAGVFIQVGTAEEKGIDTQHVLLRPTLKLLVVPSVVAAPAAAAPIAGVFAGLNSTAVNPTKADFDALLAQCEILALSHIALRDKATAMHTAAVANGQLVIA